MSLQLFAHPFSSYCQKVLIALYADGTEFEYRMLDPQHPENFAELTKRWPFNLFPMLIDDRRTVVETTCIIEHLQAYHPGPFRWIPNGERGRRVRFLDRFFDQYVMNTMSVSVFNALRPEEAKDPYGVGKSLEACASHMTGWRPISAMVRGQSERRSRWLTARPPLRSSTPTGSIGSGRTVRSFPPIEPGFSRIRASLEQSTKPGPIDPISRWERQIAIRQSQAPFR